MGVEHKGTGWTSLLVTRIPLFADRAAKAQFCFGDGSVHFLPETIDLWTYQYLGAKADGQPAAIPE